MLYCIQVTFAAGYYKKVIKNFSHAILEFYVFKITTIKSHMCFRVLTILGRTWYEPISCLY